MKNKLVLIIIAIMLLNFPKVNFGQAPNLGTAANFVLFSTAGAVTNTGISHLTGNVGTNSGSSTGFGNVNGVMHDNDGVSATCAADLTLAYNQLNATVPTFFPAPLLGNGQILNAGVYSIATPATLNLDLTLDGQGNSSAVFIFQIQGAFSTNAAAKVHLINGAKACNVFWKVEGMVSMAPATTMRGTIIANNAAISMTTNDTLEGRALSTSGAITLDGTLAYTPIGCGSPVLTGPIAPTLASVDCYALFSSIGPVTDDGNSHAIGDIGSNGGGTTTGYNPLFVVGAIHPVPDGSTAACSADLLNVYNYLNLLPSDIELLYPTQFGNNLVLTPHTYIMNASVTFTDTLYLNALGDPNAVFVIQIKGSLGTSTYSKVNLINGAQSKNIYWMVDGAVSINDYSVFNGTIICNNGAISLANGVIINGRALTTVGAVNTASVTVNIPAGSCGAISSPVITSEPSNQTACAGGSVSFSVTATGTGLTYQWRKGNVNLINGGNISGATSPILVINPATIADSSSFYNVIVFGSSQPNDTSINVSLMVNTGPTIITEPTNQAACAGGSVNFSVVATGTGLTYQWRIGSVNLINGGNISGANSTVLTINPVSTSDTAYNYNVLITGTCPPNDSSINVSLILDTINITVAPVNQTACAGGSASFSVSAVGVGLTYQWRKGLVNLINAGTISGANSATLTINPVSILDTAYNYNVLISGTCAANDSSVNVSLSVNPVYNANNPQIICAGSGYLFNGNTYTLAGNYSDTLSTINGCDSIIVTQLSVNPAYSTNNPQAICSGDTYVFNGNTYTLAGNYSDTLSTINGCDSIIVTQLSVNPIYNTNNPQTICPGNSYVINGNTYTVAGNYTDTLSTINGCDSIILTQLSINPVYNANNPQTICPGNSYVINGNIYTLAGNYTDTLSTINGCDSIIATQLSINTVYNVNNPQTICSGNSYVINGNTYTVAGNYTDTLSTINGCDSIIVTQLTVNPVYNANNPQTICSGNSYVFNGNTYTVTGNYTDTLSTINGCDSIIVTQLTVNTIPVASASSNSPVCLGAAINLSSATISGATYSWTGPNGYSSPDQNPIILTASIADAGSYTVTILSDGCTSVPSSVTVVVNNCSLTTDLSIVKTVNNIHPLIGNTIIFTIVATNNGPDNATGVEVSDILQNGYTYVSSTTTAGSYDPSTGVWIIGSMINGASATLMVTATVNSTGNYVNTAIIYSNNLDPDMSNNNSSIETFPTDFFIPEGFSPNGDGINDLFVIRGIFNFPDNTFVIFNRWGNKVFEASPYQNTWDGKCTIGLQVGGNELPVGTYFYILDLKDGSDIFKGTIYLNK